MLRKIRLPLVLDTLVVAPIVLASVSAHVRAAIGAAVRRLETWLALGALTAIVFSFGPTLDSHGRTILQEAPYLLCYLYVPGVDGLRVPARLAMVAILFLSMLAAFGFRAIVTRWQRPWIACVCVGIPFVLEAAVAPLPLNRTLHVEHFASPSGGLLPLTAPPPIYVSVEALPADAAVVELPYGIVEWDLRAMYYSLVHGRPIVNGYSGGAPDGYYANVTALQEPLLNRERAWDRLRSLPISHILVHEGAFPGGDGAAISNWLREQGAVETARFGQDVLLQLR